jgi:hypothetical protein
MAMSGLARTLQGVTDWSAKVTNGLPVTNAKLASVSGTPRSRFYRARVLSFEIDLI